MNPNQLSAEELSQQADILGKVLTLAKKEYIGAIESQEQSDAEAMLHTLDTDTNAAT